MADFVNTIMHFAEQRDNSLCESRKLRALNTDLQAEIEQLKEQIAVYENKSASVVCPKCNTIIKTV